MNNWLQLKSGTDIRGTAISDDKSQLQLYPETARKIGFSFACWLKKRINKQTRDIKISVGKDPRLSGDMLKKHLIKGLLAAGVNVFDCGLASTPAMFMSTILKNHCYEGAVMITASHMPMDQNGFKFFTEKGGLEGEDITDILKIAAEDNFSSCGEKRNVHRIDILADYSDYLKDKIRNLITDDLNSQKPLADFNIILDAGNGSGGFFVEQILEPLGADTSGSQFLEPDGRFPHHIPNPENKKALESITDAVDREGADLGIIFDTDVDRAAVVDSNGQPINRNRLIALASAIILHGNPGAAVVTDSVTSAGLTEFIEKKLNGKHHRFKRGYKNVINEAIRLNEQGIYTPLAIETSGHAAFQENYFLDDGAYLVVRILSEMVNLKIKGKKISDLISDLKEPQIADEFRMKIDRNEFKKYGKNVISDLELYVKNQENWEVPADNYEGLRVNCGANDWFLLRLSLHDPVMVLNIECDSKNKYNDIKEKLRNFLTSYEALKDGLLTN